MTLILKIAFLNILRNKRRTAITVLAILFGCVSLIIYGGFVEATYVGVRDQTIYSGMGHLQIFKKGYNKYGNTEPEKYLLDEITIQRIQAITAQIPEIELISRQLAFSGLLNNGSLSIGVFGTGIEAEQNAKMQHMGQVETIDILSGQALQTGESGLILLGQDLAETCGVKVGDSISLIASTIDGAINALDVIVGGIVTTGNTEQDQRFIQATLSDIQLLKNTRRVTRLTVLLKQTEQTRAVQKKLVQAFQKEGLAVELKNWDELADFYHQITDYYEDAFLLISLVILFVVIIGIANTMTMAVMERTAELGTLRALGNNRRQLMGLIFSESIYLGIIGAVAGILAGMALADLITACHFMQPPPPGCTRGYPYEVIYTPNLLFKAFLISVTAAFLSSIYPALKAARLNIVDALRYD